MITETTTKIIFNTDEMKEIIEHWLMRKSLRVKVDKIQRSKDYYIITLDNSYKHSP